ncbi:MAG: cell wall hydrolase, partial [Caulobacterales bacterium 68-7]
LGWASLDIKTVPTLGAPVLTDEDARRINALNPFNFDAIRPAAPFVLPAQGAERDRAVHCLTQAVYFEAATEPLEGRRAVAQTVLNRLRHPGYPKSVCGVVFEGAARASGCQFSFTCDGSLGRPLNLMLWAQAEDVARQALAGYVAKDVGAATHYHADYVLPYWAPTLIKLTQIGAHIFYRWTGPAGEPGAFTGRYAGGETSVSAEVLNGVDERIQGSGLGEVRAASATPQPERMAGVEGMVSVVAVPDPTAPGGQRLQLSGAIGGRRIPTPDEVAKINALIKERMAASGIGAPETTTTPVVPASPPRP